MSDQQLEVLWPKSKNVSRTKYIAEESVLEVEFKNKKTYHYAGFPAEKWEELKKAESIGAFIQGQVVKAGYKCTLHNQ